jgi:prepilin-type processing-associated H-X9-DG protein
LLPPGFDPRLRFGSAHASGCNFGFCDGSVRTISYQIDPEVHRRLGNRRDGLPIDGSRY